MFLPQLSLTLEVPKTSNFSFVNFLNKNEPKVLSTPIINPPQSAILGMHTIKERPIVVGDNIVAAPVMYLALSYDHRIIDGREAVQFLISIKESIEDPARMLLDI